MQYITDAREAKEIDRVSIQEIGIPSMVLMEKAALAVAGCVRANIRPEDRILAVCGTGNNGGDGVAAARLLWEAGYSVTISLIGKKESQSEEMKSQLMIAENLGIQICTGLPSMEYNVILDALFGIGLAREVTGEYAEVIHWINDQRAVCFAVDIPSGISASTGEVLKTAVHADHTITFGTNKRGLVLFPGCRYAGQVTVADIGFPKKAVEKTAPRAYTLTREEVVQMMPPRIPRSNKGSYGKVLVIAGSREISGACYLCAAASYRMGCGLVKVITAKENGPVIKTRLPEALVKTYDSGVDYTKPENKQQLLQWLEEEIQWATTIVIGPGLGLEEPAGILLTCVLQEKNKLIVVDADGLNLLAGQEQFFVTQEDGTRKICLSENVVLTPHLMEMSRLTKKELSFLRDRMVEQALHFMGQMLDAMEQITDYEGQKSDTTDQAACPTLVLKDARTIVTDGRKLYINTTGNNALSTGGSGDVLSGMIAGLLAQGMKPKEAAVLAVCLHGIAAEEYMEYGNRYSMMASDILDMLPKILPK